MLNLDLLGIDRELARRLGMVPAVKIPRPNLSFTVYQREPNSIMVTTHPSMGMLIWPLIEAGVKSDAH